MNKYDHQEVEQKWQSVWEKTDINHALDQSEKEKLYHLVMFPYPSGDLHTGHWYNFAGADFRARFKKMQGYNVMNPIGFDAFGLPAENAAIKRSLNPKDWTYSNIDKMISQLKTLGASFDWERIVVTADPEFYRWTQWMFLFMYKNGLAYKKKVLANWCPSCNTVLANEQVVGDGICERCETKVTQKELEQWLFKITEYADQLLEGLDRVDWPEKTKTMQRNWIGRSEGAEIKFQISSLKFQNANDQRPVTNDISVYTTRPDTLFGATFMVLAPEHKFVSEILTNTKHKTQNTKEIEEYVEKARAKTELQRLEGEKDKTGVFTEAYAINPANGREIPIWISDYVLSSYGHGAIMAVPAHDDRDYAFAKKFDLPIVEVIEGGDIQKEPYVGDGVHINSEYLNGLNKEQSIKKIIEKLGGEKKAQKAVNYKMRDWLISRQRYWGAPIPIVYCEKCGEVAVPEKDLPVLLPDTVEFKPTGESPLKLDDNFVNTKCPKCGGKAKRETDTMDTFVCSSWYFLRYADPKNDQEFASKSQLEKWLPVDMYIGGAEHTVLHLLYSRFFTKALHDKGYLNFDEPFQTLRHQGMILGPNGLKMSKSKGNVVDPDVLVEEVGADAVRLYMGFMGPYDQGGPWNPKGLSGVRRFIDRVWALFDVEVADFEPDLAEVRLLNQTIKKVGEDLENLRFNTAISQLMILVNALSKNKKQSKRTLGFLALMLAPLTPHLSEELWSKLGESGSVHLAAWPTFDNKYLEEELATIVVQINGKMRASLEMNKNSDQKEVEKEALQHPNVKKFLNNQTPKKVIYVPGKIINIVI